MVYYWISFFLRDFSYSYKPSGNVLHSYWKWPSRNNEFFHAEWWICPSLFVCLPEGNPLFQGLSKNPKTRDQGCPLRFTAASSITWSWSSACLGAHSFWEQIRTRDGDGVPSGKHTKHNRKSPLFMESHYECQFPMENIGKSPLLIGKLTLNCHFH